MMRFGFGIVVVVGLAAIVQPLLAAQRNYDRPSSFVGRTQETHSLENKRRVELSMLQQQIQTGKAILQSAKKLDATANTLRLAAKALRAEGMAIIDKTTKTVLSRMKTQSPEKKVFSLFLEAPQKPFGDIINRHASELGTPAFLPHVTLIGHITHLSLEAMQDKCTQLAASISGPLTLTVTDVDYGDVFWQCVYALINKTPELDDLHDNAKKLLYVDEGQEFRGPNSGFMPHVSLVYGNLSNDKKAKLSASLSEEVRGSKFGVAAIALYETGADIQGWKCIERYPLTRQ
ncbi:unnamed protein product [Vitrella brassicaformis CCMP3155]|uniref:Protein kinase A anchor protein nuclear localisation signal domain-containing protein n=2 Tax=Vitrella brassicaformis TaxID=1169539 RepID=A0A0G4ECH6_VITBC|nr:unnamed protein product [Vitrella brassicaformis CCMP3155]|eukprot:CEL93666.1 unnamed protein product [Vitrella brassicaformis CCMP3155]